MASVFPLLEIVIFGKAIIPKAHILSFAVSLLQYL